MIILISSLKLSIPTNLHTTVLTRGSWVGKTLEIDVTLFMDAPQDFVTKQPSMMKMQYTCVQFVKRCLERPFSTLQSHAKF